MRRQFIASIDHLREMLHFVMKCVESVGFGEGARNQIELATEEALVNIIEHAYKGSRGELEIFCLPEESQITITIKDHGMAFNPLEHVDHFDPKIVAGDDTTGGFGVFLITKMMDEVKYARIEGQNHLTLTKQCARTLSSAD